MTTQVEKIRRHPVADQDYYETHEVTTADDDTVSGQSVAARAVWFIAGVIMVLLAFRFVLSLLGANTTNAFANFIYTLSHPFVAPFFGLFKYNNIQYGVSRFEAYTLVAIAVYGVIAWGIAYLLTINRDR